MKIRSIFLVTPILLLAGCAASVKHQSSDVPMAAMPAVASAKLVLNVTGSPATVGSDDWEGFKQEWKENFAEQAGLVGLAFEMQDGPAKPTGEQGTLLKVFVSDYRFLRPGTRYAAGIFSGNAYLSSTLTFSDLKTGASFGTQTANTSSSAWEGRFSPMTNKQVAAIAAASVKQIKPGDGLKATTN